MPIPAAGAPETLLDPEPAPGAFRITTGVERSLREHSVTQGEAYVYIGIGTILLIILIVVLIIWVF